jgi:uncharacterized protein involved in exopolysaccharide biosynthesis
VSRESQLEDRDLLQEDRLPDFLRDPLGLARRRWLAMLLALALGLGATATALALVPPRYLAEATLLLTTQQIPENLVRNTVADDALQRLNAMLGEILSREHLAQAVDQFGLYPDLRDELTLAEIVERVRGDIHVALKPGVSSRNDRSAGRLFGIAFEAHHPEVAAAVANHLAGKFSNESLRVRSQQARLTVEFLRAELDRAERELREQSRAITEFREQHRGELPDDVAPNLARLERLRQERQALHLEATQAETQRALLEAASSPAHAPGRSGSLEASRAALGAALQRELALNTEEHPNVVALRRQLENLDAALADVSPAPTTARSEQRVVAEAAEQRLRELKAQGSRIEREIADLDARVARAPARAEALSTLLERETVLRDRYVELLRKVDEAELGQSLETAQQGERISILDRAEPPSAPTRERWVHLLLGLVGSMLLAFGVAIALEMADPVLVAGPAIEAAFGLPVLGSAPRLG